MERQTTRSRRLPPSRCGSGRAAGHALAAAFGLALAAMSLPAPATAEDAPIMLQKMGAFAFGGTTITGEKGGTQHCNHGYAQFQIPVEPRRYPIVFWHSASTVTWESSPDGRDGFQSIFLRRGFPVYIIDLPGQGRAGNGCGVLEYKPNPGLDQYTFDGWRFGTWNPPDAPKFYPGAQVPANDPQWLDQVLRARYPEAEGDDANARNAAAVGALLDKAGDSILVTHSGSGVMGFFTATRVPHVKAVVSYEPSAFVFPPGKKPEAIVTGFNNKPQDPGVEVSAEEFARLKDVKMQLVFGDFIPTESSKVRGPERRRISLIYARRFAELVNEAGGQVEVVYLPEKGIKGNTHLLMLDLNNVEVADVFSDFLRRTGLDARK
ncbi:alpha/beta fold hydrolase [Bosea sp. 117]|uniref:alpha/beta hydrolase n=1 Tax=Bosea sp. 117 TaxID=1125973 RepID=UPI000690DC0D|nr:alpha/beta fold hydrolase [Bosea sp. 117]